MGVSTARWDVVTRHDIERALPEQSAPLRVRQPVALGDGLFVAGDHRDTASIQGALVSGRRAARAVLSSLRRPRFRVTRQRGLTRETFSGEAQRSG